jgi:GMP synthase (glutamine-hydrolysing)
VFTSQKDKMVVMKIYYIQHVPTEDLGVIEKWAEKGGHSIAGLNITTDLSLPSVDEFDGLIILGGPQSACKIERYPYLEQEIDLIKKAIAANKYILGICLGGQLIAHALGAPASRSPERELGYFPVDLTDEGKQDPVFSAFPANFTSVHWHSDMMGVPDNAVVLAKTPGCPIQAIRFSQRVYGLQFHLEFTKLKIKAILQKIHSKLPQGEYVQTPEEMLSAPFDKINQYCYQFLDNFFT